MFMFLFSIPILEMPADSYSILYIPRYKKINKWKYSCFENNSQFHLSPILALNAQDTESPLSRPATQCVRYHFNLTTVPSTSSSSWSRSFSYTQCQQWTWSLHSSTSHCSTRRSWNQRMSRNCTDRLHSSTTWVSIFVSTLVFSLWPKLIIAICPLWGCDYELASRKACVFWHNVCAPSHCQ